MQQLLEAKSPRVTGYSRNPAMKERRQQSERLRRDATKVALSELRLLLGPAGKTATKNDIVSPLLPVPILNRTLSSCLVDSSPWLPKRSWTLEERQIIGNTSLNEASVSASEACRK